MNREQNLKYEFNKFLISKLCLEDNDYYGTLKTKDFIELKSVLSNINNIITLRLTLKFIENIASLFNLTHESKTKIINTIQNINPNSNGFDVEIENPIKIVAEVKGNIPINGGASFGSAQRNGILKDFKLLKNGKLKSNVANTKDFYKFFVLPDTEKTRTAIKMFLEKLKNQNEYKNYSFEILSEDAKDLNKDIIYIVFVTIDL